MSDYTITPDIIADLFLNNRPSQYVEKQIKDYLNRLYINSPEKTPTQVVDSLLYNELDKKAIIEHPEIKEFIESWLEKSSQYTYQDKIKLITNHYSNKLQNFDRAAIDNALEFLRIRYKNHGYATDEDITLTEEAKKIFELLSEYGQAIKSVFIANNIDLTHITNLPPEKMERGVLRKSIDKANDCESERVDAVFASSTPIDGRNTYIARNRAGMDGMGPICLYGNDNIEVTQDSEGKMHAMLREPNYIYYINPEKFTPVCTLTTDFETGRPLFKFTEEWISDTEVVIADTNQVKKVQKVQEVTSLLDHYTILCDVQAQGIGFQARQTGSKESILKFLKERIADGSLRNINHETGINDVDLLEEYRE